MTFTDTIKKNWIIVAATIVIIILLVVVYFVGKGDGKDTAAPDIPGDNPNDPLTDQEKVKILSIVERLHTDIYDWNPAYRDWPAYNELVASSNKIFVGVYNLYKQKYSVSLRTDMEGESYWLDQAPLVNNTNPIQLIFDRFNQLNLV